MKQLPKCYIIALNPSTNSFELPVLMQTLYMAKSSWRMLFWTVEQLISLWAPTSWNYITWPWSNWVDPSQCITLMAHWTKWVAFFKTIPQYWDHSEHVTFTVTSLRKQDIILGLTGFKNTTLKSIRHWVRLRWVNALTTVIPVQGRWGVWRQKTTTNENRDRITKYDHTAPTITAMSNCFQGGNRGQWGQRWKEQAKQQ